MVSEITFKNFKVFKSQQTLRLSPITIIIGKNNSGKSAVLKLPALVGSILEGNPIGWSYRIGDDSDNVVELGTDFKDLVYNRLETGIIELGIFGEGAKIELAVVKEYGILELKLNGTPIDYPNLNFKEKIIDKSGGNLFLNIDYLGALRIFPESVYYQNKNKYSVIGIKGQNTYSILIDDFLNSGTVIDRASNWYKNNFEGWKIEVLDSKTMTETKYEVAISNSILKPINIRQTGQGIHQVLPLIVRSFMDAVEPTLIIIEEPETHLHPSAHAVLAQRFVESYKENKNLNYLIETHSQNFILRMRRLVAEGIISCDDLAIYNVDFDEKSNTSTLDFIKVDSNGGVEKWPIGVFSETSIETRAIYNAQLNDVKNVD